MLNFKETKNKLYIESLHVNKKKQMKWNWNLEATNLNKNQFRTKIWNAKNNQFLMRYMTNKWHF